MSRFQHALCPSGPPAAARRLARRSTAPPPTTSLPPKARLTSRTASQSPLPARPAPPTRRAVEAPSHPDQRLTGAAEVHHGHRRPGLLCRRPLFSRHRRPRARLSRSWISGRSQHERTTLDPHPQHIERTRPSARTPDALVAPPSTSCRADGLESASGRHAGRPSSGRPGPRHQALTRTLARARNPHRVGSAPNGWDPVNRSPRSLAALQRAPSLQEPGPLRPSWRRSRLPATVKTVLLRPGSTASGVGPEQASPPAPARPPPPTSSRPGRRRRCRAWPSCTDVPDGRRRHWMERSEGQAPGSAALEAARIDTMRSVIQR